MKVKECMHQNVWSCTQDTTLHNAAKIMNEKHVGCIPVCNEKNQVIGIVTDRDITLRGVACGKDMNLTKVSEIMTTQTMCCNSEEEIKDVAEDMGQTGIRRMPVTENGKLVGMLSLGDFAKHNNISCEYVGITFKNICNCKTKNAQ